MGIDDLFASLEEIPADKIPAVLSQLAAAQSMLAARLMQNGNSAHAQTQTTNAGGRLLTAAEAAAKAGVSRDWFYRRSDKLPFAVRLGRSLRFSEAGLDKWIRSRSGR